LDDAIHAVLCGADHNLRMILRRLRLFLRPDSRRFARLQNRVTLGGAPSLKRQNELWTDSLI
jgi:IS5 family transposase